MRLEIRHLLLCSLTPSARSPVPTPTIKTFFYYTLKRRLSCHLLLWLRSTSSQLSPPRLILSSPTLPGSPALNRVNSRSTTLMIRSTLNWTIGTGVSTSSTSVLSLWAWSISSDWPSNLLLSSLSTSELELLDLKSHIQLAFQAADEKESVLSVKWLEKRQESWKDQFSNQVGTTCRKYRKTFLPLLTTLQTRFRKEQRQDR